MELVRVVALKGRQVFDPQTLRELPEEGADVQLNAYWQRRLLDGDIKVVPFPKSAPENPASRKES
jgi:hypothetical protein